MGLLALLACVGLLLQAGFAARHWMWEASRPIHFVGDMENAWRWGSAAAREGYWSLYDRTVEASKDGKYVLDYVPLRLAVMTLWARSRLAIDPGIKGWRHERDFNAPLLWFNTAMELAAAAGIFALSMLWVLRGRVGGPPQNAETLARPDAHDPAGAESSGPSRLVAAWMAMLPAALAWLNPASILSAHARPTWDVWITPFFAWAVFCGCLNRWFLAGVLVGVGTLFKGQQLIFAPLFLLWPLMGLRVGAAARWLAGFAVSVTAVVLPWLVPMRFGPLASVIVVLGLVAGAWALARRRAWSRLSVRALGWLMAGGFVGAAWLCVPLFGGSLGWFRIGFVYGAEKFPGLEVGGASSLAGILQHSYRWRHNNPVFTFPGTGTVVTIEQVLIAAFAVMLLASVLAMHRLERRRDRRFLLAVAAPWIAYFAVAPRMHERYLLWGALLACSAAVVRPGPTLLAIFFSLCSAVMSLYQMLNRSNARHFLTDTSPTFGQSLQRLVHGTFPGLGWGILLATLVWMYLVLVPRDLRPPRWWRRQCIPPPREASAEPGPPLSLAESNGDGRQRAFAAGDP